MRGDPSARPAPHRWRPRELFIDGQVFPPGIRGRVRKRHPQLTGEHLDLVFGALRDCFHLRRKAAARMLATPSQVVDPAWHEFILCTRNDEHSCCGGGGDD